MVLTESKPNFQELLNVPYVELSFGIIGETLPADHGYGLYSAITLPSLGGSLKTHLMPQGVEHYARIRTLFQSLNLRCRKALVNVLFFEVFWRSLVYVCAKRTFLQLDIVVSRQSC
jgi:hypothetical protein